jgi:tryptophan-rich sensory protein
MMAAGLRFCHLLPKQVRRPRPPGLSCPKEVFVLRWFLIFAAIAIAATAAGYVVFNGGSLGH